MRNLAKLWIDFIKKNKNEIYEFHLMRLGYGQLMYDKRETGSTLFTAPDVYGRDVV